MPSNPPPDDHATLAALNADYIRSVQQGDVKRFEEILAPDFLNSNPDGTLVDRAGFLAQIARAAAPSPAVGGKAGMGAPAVGGKAGMGAIRNLAVEDVRIRVLRTLAGGPSNTGDTAIIHARTTYTKPDDTPGAGRYTDIWQRRTLAGGASNTERDGKWLCVAAHVTRA